MLSPRRRDAASFDSGPLFSAFRPTQSRSPPKRANAVVAVVSVVPVHRARGIDVADVVRVGRYKPHPKKNAGHYRRGVIPLFCCSAANRSLSCFLHFAVMFFTFITCRVHSAHCSEEISSFSKESSIRKRTVLLENVKRQIVQAVYDGETVFLRKSPFACHHKRVLD